MNAKSRPKNNICVKKGWGECPLCGNPKMIKVKKNTELKEFPAYCKYCRTEIIVNWTAQID